MAGIAMAGAWATVFRCTARVKQGVGVLDDKPVPAALAGAVEIIHDRHLYELEARAAALIHVAPSASQRIHGNGAAHDAVVWGVVNGEKVAEFALA
jgi:hypothetical protein